MNITTAISDIPTVVEKSSIKEQETADQRIKRQKMEFFKLLTTQLQNQDPLDPMDTTEMTSQLFQISHVEQQLHANKLAEETLTEIRRMQHNNSLQYIDSIVEFPGNAVQAYGGKALFGYDLPAGAKEVKINIFDSNGKLSHSEKLATTAGYSQFIWNKPSHQADGIYTFAIEAKDDKGEPLAPKTFSVGRVDSVVQKEGISYLDVMNKLVPVDQHHRIRSGAGIEALLLTDIKEQVTQLYDSLSGSKQPQDAQDATPVTVPITDQHMVEKLKNDPQIMEAIKKQLNL